MEKPSLIQSFAKRQKSDSTETHATHHSPKWNIDSALSISSKGHGLRMGLPWHSGGSLQMLTKCRLCMVCS